MAFESESFVIHRLEGGAISFSPSSMEQTGSSYHDRRSNESRYSTAFLRNSSTSGRAGTSSKHEAYSLDAKLYHLRAVVVAVAVVAVVVAMIAFVVEADDDDDMLVFILVLVLVLALVLIGL